MILFNTLSRTKEKLTVINPPMVGIYSCGPTVYDYTHIGHIRTYIFVDILQKSLKFIGFEPKLVMNITDVGHLTSDADFGEDKMEKGAQKEGKTVWEIAKFYTDYFFKVMDNVGIQRPDIICKATDNIPEMIALVKQLEAKGYTYKTADGIYFDTSKFSDYPKIARIDIKGLQEGARVEKNLEKRNPTDFALWKFTPSGTKRQMEWDSPWGKGFPGWHIECSAMSMKYLGGGERSRTIDIHTGGVDHIPVHHTNEIAQSEAATGKKFVNYWLHAGHLVVEGKKMSKSLGNFLKLEDIQKKGFESLALRYLFLTGHYRSTMNFEWSALEGANQALKKLRSKIPNSKFPACSCLKQQRLAGRQILNKNPKLIDKYQKRFIDYISDDLNMPKVLALVWEVVKSDLTQAEKRVLLLAWDKVLGLDLVREEKIDQEILELVKKRDDLRSERKWQEADKIRIEIETKGYLVEDTNKASVVKKK